MKLYYVFQGQFCMCERYCITHASIFHAPARACVKVTDEGVWLLGPEDVVTTETHRIFAMLVPWPPSHIHTHIQFYLFTSLDLSQILSLIFEITITSVSLSPGGHAHTCDVAFQALKS